MRAMRPSPLLVPACCKLDDGDLRALRDAIYRRSGVLVAPVQVPYAALIPQLLEDTRDALAWASSCVASTLVRLRLATPIAAAPRRDGRGRSAVLVGRAPVEGLGDLRGRRAGWVSKLSAAGYQVPRLYLESFGVDPAALFASEQFLGSHAAAVEALADGSVDVVATHSGRLRELLRRASARVVASVGPIPADLVVAGCAVPPGIRSALGRAMSYVAVGAYDLAPVDVGHLELFEALHRDPPDARWTPAILAGN